MVDRKVQVLRQPSYNGMQRLVSVVVMVLMVMMSIAAVAKKKGDESKQRFPSGCYQQGFSFKHQVLHLHPPLAGKEQSMFFIHNLSESKPVKLYQMRSGDETFIMHLNNSIKANQWGVFASDEVIDKFICTVPKPGHKYGKIIDCKDYLDVCEYTNVKFSTINAGNYWVVNSSSMRSAQRSAIRQGSLLRR